MSMSDRFTGILLGTAVGDSLGLPAEGLSPRRRQRLFRGPWRQRLVFGHGMVSDDTEHTLFVAQSLLKHPADAAAFQKRLAWHVKWWFAGVPAGIGLATVRACLKLWLGFPSSRCGVFSAGNGPAMRSAILGAYFADDPPALERFVRASTELTHSDPRALVGALAIARAAAWAVSHDPKQPPDDAALRQILGQAQNNDQEWPVIVEKTLAAWSAGASVAEFADTLGLKRGVTGYMYHTVPVALYAWLVHWGDFRAAVSATLDCGGDTDTVGAIVGAIAGATVGSRGIPECWLRGIRDWPRSTGLLQRVAERLAQQRGQDGPLGETPYPWAAIPVRNFLSLLIVLVHAARRLAPPY